jgi:transposase-like protein
MAIVPDVPGCTMERVPSSLYVICLGDAERAELESLSRRATAPFRLVVRARVVLLAADGLANCAIAERLGICEDTARKWRRRYCEQGIEGLADAPRPGRPRVFPATVVAGSRPWRARCPPRAERRWPAGPVPSWLAMLQPAVSAPRPRHPPCAAGSPMMS